MSDENTTPDAEEAPQRPLLSIVRGNPTDEDVAILTALVSAAASSSGGPAGPQTRDDWGNNEDRLRQPWGAPSSFTNLRR